MATGSKKLKDIIKELNKVFTKDHIYNFIEQYYKYIVNPDNNLNSQLLAYRLLKGGVDLKSEFEKLPIFFIIAHSSFDVKISNKIEPIIPPDINSNFFKMPISEDLSKNKFLVFNSPVGTLGLVNNLRSPYNCLNHSELLNVTDIKIKENLFSSNKLYHHKLGNYKCTYTKSKQFRNNGVCMPEEGLSPSFYLPGSIVMEKKHHFYSDDIEDLNGIIIVK